MLCKVAWNPKKIQLKRECGTTSPDFNHFWAKGEIHYKGLSGLGQVECDKGGKLTVFFRGKGVPMGFGKKGGVLQGSGLRRHGGVFIRWTVLRGRGGDGFKWKIR